MAKPASLTLIQPDEARRILAETPPVGKERVALGAALGRVLAEAFTAPADLPGERRAVMDGYAVRGGDVRSASALSPVVLAVTGTVPMGDVFPRGVGAGDAVAIATGGFLPEGADAVVMVEHTTALDGGARVEVSRAVAPGANVVERGEDLARGAAVLPAGRRLRPQDLAMLATFGVTTVDVHRRPRVAVLSTGNELVDPAETPRPGQVRDANQTALGAQVTAAGCDVTYAGIVADDATSLRRAIARLLDDPVMRVEMGAAGRRRAEEFSWPRVTGKVEDYYGFVIRRLAATGSLPEDFRSPVPQAPPVRARPPASPESDESGTSGPPDAAAALLSASVSRQTHAE